MGAIHPMSTNLPEDGMRGEREATEPDSGSITHRTPRVESLDARQQADLDTDSLYRLVRKMISAFGGQDALVSVLDEKPTYESQISMGLHRKHGHGVRLEWLAALIGAPAVGEILLRWLSDRLGYEPPTRRRSVTTQERNAAIAAVVDDLGPLREAVRTEAAKRLGVRPEDL